MRDLAPHLTTRSRSKAICALLTALLLSLQVYAQSGITLDEAMVRSSFHRNGGIRRTADTLWLMISATTASRYLLVENPHVNHIGMDRIREGSRIRTGDSLPFAQRPIPFRMFALPIAPCGEKDTIRLILEKKGENLSYSIRLLGRSEWERYVHIDHLLVGFISGCYVLVLMIGIVLMYFNRQVKFLFFNAYVLTSLGWFLNDAGLLYQVLWPDHPSWHNSSRGFFSSVTMAFFGSYLYQNPGSRILQGVRKAMYVLVGIIAIKICTGLMAATGVFPASLKPFTMHVNGIAVSGLFGYIAFTLLLNLGKYRTERFEILGIVTYSLFIFQLGMHELGLRPFGFAVLHHMEVIAFFFIQIACMALHLFTMEKRRRLAEADHMLQITREQDRILSERLIEMEEQEKSRIARNIHDEIGSLFAAMKYRILSLGAGQPSSREELDQLMHICNEGIEKQYSVVDDMVVHGPKDEDFEQSIRDKFRQLFGHGTMTFELQCHMTPEAPDEFQRIQLFRIITELMTNTLKHADATSITLRIEVDRTIHISYQDDGPGFEAAPGKKGRGLSNIGNRVAYLQGSCHLKRQKDGDWTFHIEIPIRHE